MRHDCAVIPCAALRATRRCRRVTAAMKSLRSTTPAQGSRLKECAAVQAVEIAGDPPRFHAAQARAGSALDGVSLTIPVGEVHGLLGPERRRQDHAREDPLDRAAADRAGARSSAATTSSTETKAVRPLIGIVFGGERGLYTRLTARQNLEYWARSTGSRERRSRRAPRSCSSASASPARRPAGRGVLPWHEAAAAPRAAG